MNLTASVNDSLEYGFSLDEVSMISCLEYKIDLNILKYQKK